MSYIITAEVIVGTETNYHGDRSKVNARVLSDRGGILTFDVQGEFGDEAARTLALCMSLIDAGFYEFSIGHSY